MSWDKTEREYPCPCGKGKYTVTNKDSGWKETETLTMDCPDCRENYTEWRSDTLNGRSVWVPKKQLEMHAEAEKDLGRMVQEAVRNARNQGIDTFDPVHAIETGALGKDDIPGKLDEYYRRQELVRELEAEFRIASYR